jgi:phosphoglycerol transferase MdoB-like AlkP superfamily enzyme
MMQTAAFEVFGLRFAPVDRRRLWLRLACALVWALELFWLQKLSFAAVPWVRFPLLTESFRLYLDVVFATGVVMLLDRRFLTPLLVLSFLWMTVLAAYLGHFHRPLMPFTVFYELKEAWSLHAHTLDLLPIGISAALLASLAFKLFLLWRSGDLPREGFSRVHFGCMLALLYLLPVNAMQLSHLRLNTRPSTGNMRNVYAYGYSLPWICDLVANRSLQVHARRAERLLGVRYDRISPLEKPLSIPKHLVILQLESVDGPAIDARCGGEPVMPFLGALQEQSMRFRIVAFHFNGSCDMDYPTVTFAEPYPNLVPYRLPGINYTNSLPAFMKKHGFKSYFYHGNGSMFYDRGAVIERLGFDGVFFKEQLASRGFHSSIIGFRDADVLGCVLERLTNVTPVCVFAITLDTHVPFRQLEASEMKVFPNPESDAERFLNAANYLDGCLKRFVEQMPAGTTLMLYGDHTPSLEGAGYRSDVVNGKHYVRCLIYQKGANLAEQQQTRNSAIASDGSLNLLDVLSYVRGSIEHRGDEGIVSSAARMNR